MKTAKEVISQIRKLLFADEAKVTEQKVEETASPEAVVETTETVVEETTEAVVETQVTQEQKFDSQNLADQVASLTKQLEVLSEFAMLKEQVTYLMQWAKDQLVRDAAYKEAFSELLPLIERMDATPQAEVATEAKGKFSEHVKDKKDRLANFVTAINAVKKADKEKK